MIISITQCKSSSHPSSWSEQKLNEWFESGQYLNGLPIRPDPSIDRRAFATHYYENKVVWDKAFAFLKATNLPNLPLGRIELGDNLFATVSEYFPKDPDTTLFEAHQRYIDIQYVISGREIINIAPLESMTITVPFNAQNDIVFGTVPKSSGLKASPDRFFIIFPAEAHRPGIMDGSNNSLIRKIVVKVPM
jgi:YhcH/YjgK/YiaL family protein